MEKTFRFASGQHFKSFLVVKRYFFNIDVNISVFVYQLHGVFQNCQIANTQKIKFGKPYSVFADRIHIILSDYLIAFSRIELYWHVFQQWFGSDDYAGGMYGNMADGAFKFFSDIKYLASFSVTVVKIFEPRF